MDQAEVELALEVLGLSVAPPGAQPVDDGEPEMALIPYEKQNRVAEALVTLETDTATATQIDAQRLVMLAGVTGEGGREGGLFEVRHDRAVERVVGFLIAYRSGDKRLHIVQRSTRVSAEERWADVRDSINVISQALRGADDG